MKRPTSFLIRSKLHTKTFDYAKLNLKNYQQKQKEKVTAITLYAISAAVLFLGLTYAFVPAYRIFCETTGLDGSLKYKETDLSELVPNKKRKIQVTFMTDTAKTLNWNFIPEQREVYVFLGETSLAFFKAKNNSSQPITGISTYNVSPPSAAQYFNKIQCFCFEQQLLSPNEEVDMPLFFYIDPELDNDPELSNLNEVILSYVFFESKNFNYDEWYNSLAELKENVKSV